MRKLIHFALMTAVAGLLAGCGQNTEQPEEASADSGDQAQQSTADPSREGQTAQQSRETPEGSSAESSAAQDSPAATFGTFKSSIAEKQWDRTLACLTPQSQDTFVGMLMMAAGFSTVGDEAKQKEFEEMLNKHGVNPNQQQPAPGTSPQDAMSQQLADADKPALLGDLMTWMEDNLPENAQGQTPADGLKNAELGDITTSEDTARGQVTQEEGRISPIAFQKMDGKWYIDYETIMREQMQQQQNQQAPMPPQQGPQGPPSVPQQ